MPILSEYYGAGTGGGGGGGGGGGLHFRDPADSFTAASLSAARTARDTYFATNPGIAALPAFQGDPSLAIILAVTGATTRTFETYLPGQTGGYDNTQWVERSDAVQGNPGPQSRFFVYAWVNSAVAPTAVPTGGTYVQSTGVKTVPVGYTVSPVTPVLTERTYRTQAPVNPANDADIVNLVWSLPAESPEYDAAGIAEEAADRAETAQALAEQAAGQAVDIPTGSPRGALVATSPTLPTAATGSNSVIAFGTAELWTLEADAPDGYEAGPAASNERLYLPDIHPAGAIGMWVVVEVGGIEIAEVFISQGGIQGATGADRRHILPVSVTADALIRIGFWPRSSTVASYIQITGNSDTLAANTVVKVYLAVVRGGDGGGGGGGTNATNLAVENRDADSLDVTSDTGTDATLPSASATEAGLMSAADKTVLDNAGGLMRFGIVDPVATDGNNRDTWWNTTDGTLWTKAAGAWTKQFTLPSGTSPDPGDHTRRAAIAAGAALTEAEVTAGTSSMTQVVVAPDSTDWPSGTLRTLYLGVPDDEDAITDVEEGGLSVLAGFEHYEDVNSAKIIVSGHQWVRSISTLDGELNASRSLTIVQ